MAGRRPSAAYLAYQNLRTEVLQATEGPNLEAKQKYETRFRAVAKNLVWPYFYEARPATIPTISDADVRSWLHSAYMNYIPGDQKDRLVRCLD